ncbi:MAG: TIGR03936 family radical SAM-associated protein [Phycisphaerae bacterium]|nr:TIGR03936 family radical SAM-associated protein [Phycisphaerae bacterium]
MLDETFKLIVDFSIQGDLAYLSHQETLTLFQRALIRASVPLVFSGGFNPHPCLSIPFPRSVGTQSIRDRMCAVVRFSQPPSAEYLRDSIQRQLPADCGILDVQYTDRKRSFYPESVRYRFCLESCPDGQWREHLLRCKRQVDEKSGIEIRRYWAKKRRYKQFDMAPYLSEITFSDDRIEAFCRISPSGTVRVDEIMQWLTIEPGQLREPVCRTEISWRQN